MSLFAVSGWNAPAKVAASDVVNSRKRKRAAVAEEDAKVQAATVNIEKLMRKLQTGSTRLQRKEKKKENVHKLTKEVPNGGDVAKVNNKDLAQRQKSIKSSPANESKKKKRQENLKDTKFIVEKRATADTSRNHGESAVVKHETTAKGLTALQSTMKSSLEGARFRHINELLYKSTSEDAAKLVQKDPSIIEDYHTGFRHQVKSWPINPVNQYISEIAAMKQPLVVADLGCGDAAIAKELGPQGVCVLSYDLRSDGHYITEADICNKLPLPGSETHDGIDGGQVVDIVICALSLMSTNWVQCIREARRVLKPNGLLKIAEVTSRFEDVDAFVKLVETIGHNLTSKDTSNTHFIKFDFVKTPRKGKELDWKALGKDGKLLKPCEYKRR